MQPDAAISHSFGGKTNLETYGLHVFLSPAHKHCDSFYK